MSAEEREELLRLQAHTLQVQLDAALASVELWKRLYESERARHEK
ncbi:hypothetical protein [Microbacterium kunmingense]|nr:hypothetical protein [Microbacterium kunmingense]